MEVYISSMDHFDEHLKQRLTLVVDRQQKLLGEFTAAMIAGDHVRQAELQRDLNRFAAEMRRLTAEARYGQLQTSAANAVPRSRAREVGKTIRELVLDSVDEIGVPSSPATISEFSQIMTGASIDTGRFASLRRDEQKAALRDAASRPVWVAPAISSSRLTAMPRLFTSSAWPIERRIVGPRSARVDHLRATLAFLDRFERLQAAGAREADSMELLAVRFARGVPGAMSAGVKIDVQRVRDATLTELEAIEQEDIAERQAAAVRLQKFREQDRIWGLPIIDGGAKGERAGT
jgi:hypothetical protein